MSAAAGWLTLTLTVTVASSDPATAQLVTSSTTGGSVTVEVPTGLYDSPSTVATGGVALDALSAGSTTVSVSATGYLNTFIDASLDVTVSP